MKVELGKPEIGHRRGLEGPQDLVATDLTGPELLQQAGCLMVGHGGEVAAQAAPCSCTAISSMPRPSRLRLRMYFFSVALFQCSCTPRLVRRRPSGW